MKIVKTTILMCTLFILFAGSGQADSLVRGGQWADAAPKVAYNSVNEEYLVVWNEFLTVPPFYGPVMGRILDKNGQKISPSFQIFESGVKPSVVYDPDRNEYCVVCESNFTTYVQFITDRGLPADGGFFKSNSTFPRVLYNTLAQNFLLVFIVIQENPAGSGNCDRALVAVSFDRDQFSSEHQILNLSNSACTDGEYFAVAFAPVDSPLTPNGRYLVGVDNVNLPLYMLNKDGERVQVKDGTGGVGYQIDFDSEAISPVNMDISFGYRNNNPQDPVFLVVWGEKGQRTYDGSTWTWPSTIISVPIPSAGTWGPTHPMQIFSSPVTWKQQTPACLPWRLRARPPWSSGRTTAIMVRNFPISTARGSMRPIKQLLNWEVFPRIVKVNSGGVCRSAITPWGSARTEPSGPGGLIRGANLGLAT